MKLYITSGTQSFLTKMMEEHQNKELILMQNEDQFILIHQSEEDTFFKEPRKYEVITGFGKFPKKGFAAFHYIPVTDEGRPLFEYHFKNQAVLMQKEPNLTAIRVLRPLASDTYLILTVWEHETSYKNWKPAKSFEEAYSKTNTGKGNQKLPKVFPRPSFITRYTIVNNDKA
ncbi:antibiotic biosynthesis monooxygenase family protein [Niallia endozanthoxylica]|uniref:Antibiotic biosynthesis monooxygenase n=1 Tax=Niallia endozanthoxylica TaxID=2036016 RepID=A0A5J5I6A5_9BACI|nr:antibiotic biosynthesis monooxygenase [Niallia endozanthoxylica]KAA9031688.1 antibiotic biosynthesis monooxygenase [Niallia endozanthoxylica]